MRNPRDFLKPLAIDAPEPAREIPFKPSRMIHFLDFSNEKMVAKVPDIAPTVDILLGNLEDAVALDKKEAARDGLIRVGREMDLGETALWTRVNELASPYLLDDVTQLVAEAGNRIEVMMLPKVEGRGTSSSSTTCSPSSRRSTACSARSSCTRSSRPRSASPTSRRSPPPVLGCRASRSGRPTSPRRGG